MVKKLKPIIYTSNTYAIGSAQHSQQVILLKALQVTTDPKKLRQMMGVRTVAEVYRTLDKLAMRKEYHAALERSGISFDYITNGLKNIADTGFKDSDKLNALKVLLKSLGMEKYEASDQGSSGTWEEELLKTLEQKKEVKALSAPDTEYDVKVPEMPEAMKKMRQKEAEITKGIYE